MPNLHGAMKHELSLGRERIEDVDANALNIRSIPCDEDQAIRSRCGCKQGIDYGKGTNGIHSPPLIGNFLVHLQNSVTEASDHLFEPSL